LKISELIGFYLKPGECGDCGDGVDSGEDAVFGVDEVEVFGIFDL
jgi:hypothetical protein